MAKSKNEYNQKETKELKKTLLSKEKELLESKISAEQRKTKDVHLVRKVRKEIAQIKTAIKEKTVGG